MILCNRWVHRSVPSVGLPVKLHWTPHDRWSGVGIAKPVKEISKALAWKNLPLAPRIAHGLG